VRQDTAALRYCCAFAFLEVSEFYQLPHGAITPQYVKDLCLVLKAHNVRREDKERDKKFEYKLILSLPLITQELLEWESSGSGSRKSRLTATGIRWADHATLSIRKSRR
jgi:hypothetical protein